MIHFAPDVKIEYFCYELLPILLNAAAWSSRKCVGVKVARIDTGQYSTGFPCVLGCAVDLRTDLETTGGLEDLFGYLQNYIPRDFDVTLESTHVRVEWSIERGLRRLKK